MTQRLKFSFVAVLLVLFAFGLSHSSSPAYDIPRQVMDGGGAMWLATTSYKLSSSLAQPITGAQQSTSYKLYTGFWNPWVVEMSPVEGEEDDADLRPSEFTLSQNFPNPFNPTTVIQYALPKTTQVRIEVYNVLGQRVRTLVDETQEPGYKIINWDGKDDAGNEVSSGVYFCRIQAGDFVKSRKMTLLK
jgi:hypothetical protein